MSDELLLQNILTRLEAMDGKIDKLREAIHDQGINEVDQTRRLDKIEIRMDGFEATLKEIAEKCTVTQGADDATELSQGMAAGLRMAMRNHKLLWVIIAIMSALGLIDSTALKNLIGAQSDPAAVTAEP